MASSSKTKTKRKAASPGWRDRAAEIGRRIVEALRGPTPVPVRASPQRSRR